MIKAKAVGKDKTIIVLGLSWENLKRLKEGQPIMFDFSDLNIPGFKCTIFAGETEQSMAEEIKDLIGPDTKVKGL